MVSGGRAVLAAVLVVTIGYRVLRFFGRRSSIVAEFARRCYLPTTVISALTGLRVTMPTIAGLGVMLMTFPQARAAGASVLASAGVVAVIVALAARSMLGNVIAGLQLAFGDASASTTSWSSRDSEAESRK